MCHDDRAPRIGPSAQLARRQIDVGSDDAQLKRRSLTDSGRYSNTSPRTLRDSSLQSLHQTSHVYGLYGDYSVWGSIHREEGSDGAIGRFDLD